MSRAFPGTNRKDPSQSAIIVFFSALALLVHLLTNGRYGYFRDELYYIACGRHLAFGYVDQPPLSILLLRLSQVLLGDSLFAIRLLPALAGAAISCAHRNDRARTSADAHGHRSRVRGIALCAVQPGSRQFLLHERVRAAVLDGMQFICSSALSTAAHQRFGSGWACCSDSVWKTNIPRRFSLPVFFVGLLLTPERRHFAEKWIWLGGVIAFAIALPNILWQAQHHWPTYELLSNIAHSDKNVALSPAQFIAQQIVFMNPATLPLWFGGLCLVVWVARRPALPRHWNHLPGHARRVHHFARQKLLPRARVSDALCSGRGGNRARFRRPLHMAEANLTRHNPYGRSVTCTTDCADLAARQTGRVHASNSLGTAAHRDIAYGNSLPQVFADQFGWEQMVGVGRARLSSLASRG